MTIRPAPRYERAGDLWVVTSYYNPHRYATRDGNFALFRESMVQSGLPFLAVECAFEGQSFSLAPGPDVLQIRARDVLWQKERLLNEAIGRLPAECTKVAWLDADVLFARADWATATSALLDTCAVVQPFREAIWLPRGARRHEGGGDVYEGFCARIARDPDSLYCGRFEGHGHTGFGWAARRSVIAEVGLYDACLSGSGDHLMAHAAAGDWTSPCIPAIVGRGSAYAEHFKAWAERFAALTGGRAGFVDGAILHLWHGDEQNRRYGDRNAELVALGFDPGLDLRAGPSGAWEWSRPAPELHRWAVDYFAHRKEDGS